MVRITTAIRFAVSDCPLGSVLIGVTDKGVCAILLGDRSETLVRELQERFPEATLVSGDQNLESLVAKVVALVEAPTRPLCLPLDLRGTAFQRRVWQALRDIPAGSTVSYTEIAERVGSPKAVRSVAQACAANAIAIVIPCHRVVRKSGALSGYRWGVERKRALLHREGAI